MQKIFIILLFFFVMTGSAAAQQGNVAADPNAPAPASPLHLRIPHSERTKSNFLDSALDFVFSRFFSSLKDPITYEFFKVENKKLIFSNLTMNLNRGGAKGTVFVGRATFNMTEFVNGMESNKLMFSEVTLEKMSLDLNVSQKKAETSSEQTANPVRKVKAFSEKVTLDKIRLLAWGENKTQDISIETASGTKVSVDMSNPAEKYAANAITLQDVLISVDDPVHQTKFASASADGKSYQDNKAFLQGIKKAK